MFQHSYAVNALIEFPHNGSKGRATRSGHIETVLPATEDELRSAVARQQAEKSGCAPDQVVFVEFAYTELP
jgi:hypothetical protein